MGGCLEPTPEMGPFAVEIRRESFYLSARASELQVRDAAWSVRREAISALLAAFNQAWQYSEYIPADPGWEIRSREEWVDILGPGNLYGGKKDVLGYSTIELEYRHLNELELRLKSLDA